MNPHRATMLLLVVVVLVLASLAGCTEVGSLASTKPVVPCTSEPGASTQKSVYFALDNSPSMDNNLASCADNPEDASRVRLGVAKEGLVKVLSTIEPDVCLGLLSFGPVVELVPLGRDNKAEILRIVQALPSGNGTPLNAAIKFSSERILAQRDRQLGYGDLRVVILTDGEPTDGGDLREAHAAREAGVNIFTVGFCLPEGAHPLNNPEITVSYMEANSPVKLVTALRAMVPESDQAFDATLFEKSSSQK